MVAGRTVGLAAVLVLLAVSLAMAQTNPIETKEAFDGQLKQFSTEHDSQLTDWDAKYLGVLNKLLTQVTNAGDLKKSKAVLAEIEDLKKDPSLVLDAADSDVAEMQALRAKYIKTVRQIDEAYAMKVLAAVGQYDRALEARQKNLTRQKALDRATDVQDERARAQSLPDVQTAKAILQGGKSAPKRMTTQKDADGATGVQPAAVAPQDEKGGAKQGYPEGTFEALKHHYHIDLSTAMSFQAAGDHCKSLGGHILSIDSKAEHEFWSKKVKESGETSIFWLDISNTANPSKWLTSAGKKPAFVNWAGKPEPRVLRNAQTAACVIGYTDEWWAFSVDSAVRVIVEWDR